MIRRALLLFALVLPAAAQEGPTLDVALDPAGPVIVGAPLRVAVTVLAPSFLPAPPDWPDLQIADAVTRLPSRATTPVTRRVGAESWSGLTRTYEVIPQRAADYDLSGAAVAVTWSGEDATPQRATLPLPDIAFQAIVPPGAEGLDPFLAASALSVEARIDGLPAAPKPGDALTLTLTTTASGPPALLLPPLAEALPTPEGLRAYPKEPEVVDVPGERGAPATARRVERITYVIEAPGDYLLPAVTLRWWDVAGGSPQTASTTEIRFDVAAPPGWRPPGEAGRSRLAAPAAVLAAAGLSLVLLAVWRRGKSRRAPKPPSEATVYRALRQQIRKAPAGGLRTSVLDWLRLAAPSGASLSPDLEAALVAVERAVYGLPTTGAPGATLRDPLRRDLLSALAAERARLPLRRHGSKRPRLAPLNP